MTIEIDGVSCSFFGGPEDRTIYRFIECEGTDHAQLSTDLIAAVDFLKKYPEESVLYWRIRPVLTEIRDEHGEPTGIYRAFCRLSFFPDLPEVIWTSPELSRVKCE